MYICELIKNSNFVYISPNMTISLTFCTFYSDVRRGSVSRLFAHRFSILPWA